MKKSESATTTAGYPTTSTFEVPFEESVHWAEKGLDISDRLKNYPCHDDRYYDAMAELDAVVTTLPIPGRSLRKGMDHVDDLFPEDDE